MDIDLMNIEERLLSPLARVTAQAVGIAGLIALMRHYAGQEVLVPVTPDGSDKLNAVLSYEQRAALVARYENKTDRRLYIPKEDRILSQARAAQVRRLRAEGLSGAEVARRLNLSRRWVVYLTGAERREQESAQGDLFSGGLDSAQGDRSS
jgi:hypothetical protein